MTLKSLMFTEQLIHDYTLIHVVKQYPGQEITITGHWYEDKIMNLMDEPIASLTWRSGPDLTVYLMDPEQKATWELDNATASALRKRPYNRSYSSTVRCKASDLDRTEASRQEAREALNTIFGMEITDAIRRYTARYQDIDTLKGGD